MFTIEDFKPGQRIALHPATDLWMRGARFADVVSVGPLALVVKLDNGHETKLVPMNVGEIVS